jgi:putative SOS response-associated peptidase YedK
MLPNSAEGGENVKQRYILSGVCGRSTYQLTWEEIVALYRLTWTSRRETRRCVISPTTAINTVAESDGKRQLVPKRWGLVPSWWSFRYWG